MLELDYIFLGFSESIGGHFDSFDTILMDYRRLLQILLLLGSFLCLIIDIHFLFLISVNSDEAVSLTNSLKASILKVSDAILKSLKTAVIKVLEPISKAVVYLLKSEEALGFFEAFQKLLFFLVTLLFAIIGLHFGSLDISPLETHYAIFLLFLLAIFVYGLAYVLIAVQPRDSEYLSKLRFICLVFGTIAIELPASIIISPFWLFMVNLCSILIIGVLCSYKQIHQFVCQIYGWLLQRFQSAPFPFQAFFSRERGDNNNQVAEIV